VSCENKTVSSFALKLCNFPRDDGDGLFGGHELIDDGDSVGGVQPIE
jgi:hypothetical protein